MNKKWITTIICLALPPLIGFTSGWLTRNESGGSWYQALEKPWFNPPPYVFGPVWTLLYILMGISLYFVYHAPPSPQRRTALLAFAIQMALNFAWSLIFFRYHLLGLAAIEIVILLAAIIWLIITFHRVRPIAAFLQIPYAGWVSFATILTITIYALNR